MDPQQTNANNVALCLAFKTKQQAWFYSYVKVIPDCPESDTFKLDLLSRAVEKVRREFTKYEQSLDWEDE